MLVCNKLLSTVAPITEGFKSSQNIIVKPWVYMSFSSIRYSFMHFFSYKIGLCFAIFHEKCTERFLFFSKYIGILCLVRVGQYWQKLLCYACSAHTFEKQHSFFQAGHAYIVSSYCLNSLLSHDYKMLWGSKKGFYTPFMGISEMTDYLDIVILCST